MNTKILALASAVALALGISSINIWAEDTTTLATEEMTQTADDPANQEPIQVITADEAPIMNDVQRECIPREEKNDDGKESDDDHAKNDDNKHDDDEKEDHDDHDDGDEKEHHSDKDDDVKQDDEKSHLPYCDEEKSGSDDVKEETDESPDKNTEPDDRPADDTDQDQTKHAE